MTPIKREDLIITKGKTFQLIVNWEVDPIVYRPITNIQQSAPARLTVPSHGIPDQWQAVVVSVKGMEEINCKNKPIRETDYTRVTVIDPNTVELNKVNAADFRAYISGGYLQFNTPASLVGYEARMSIKDKKGAAGVELLRLDTTNLRIALNDAEKTITLTIDATTTAGIDWTKGVYDLEMVSSNGTVTAIMAGAVAVEDEATTT